MIRYFKMKRAEFMVKTMMYESLAEFMNNQKEIMDLVKNLYTALKDVPVEELRQEFITKLAEIIHYENS